MARSNLDTYEARELGGLPTKRVVDIGAPDELAAAYYDHAEDLGLIAGARLGTSTTTKKKPPPPAPPGRAVSLTRRLAPPAAPARSTATAASPIATKRTATFAKSVDYNQLTQAPTAPTIRTGGAAAVVAAYQAQPTTTTTKPISLTQSFAKTASQGGVIGQTATQAVANYVAGGTPIYQTDPSARFAPVSSGASAQADEGGGGGGGGGGGDAQADAAGGAGPGGDPRSALTTPVSPRAPGEALSGLGEVSGTFIDPATGTSATFVSG